MTEENANHVGRTNINALYITAFSKTHMAPLSSFTL